MTTTGVLDSNELNTEGQQQPITSTSKMTSTDNQGLSSDRIRGPSGIHFDDFQCSICHNILWKPIVCQSCETPFCSACIAKWLDTNPGKCPMKCNEYIERPCPRFIAKQLAKLQIDCIYQSNGCDEVIPYEALEKHETQCGHQPQQCPGCRSQMFKKDLIEHEVHCELTEWTCADCKLVYKRRDVAEHHTDRICLGEQFRQLRHESEKNKRELQKLRQDSDEYSQQLTKRQKLLPPVTLTFADIPHGKITQPMFFTDYKNLKWTGFWYMHEQCVKEAWPNSGYATAFTTGGSPYIVGSCSSASISVDHQNNVFSDVSLEVCAAWNDHVQLTITGHRKSTQVKTHTLTLLYGKPQLIQLDWTDIDMLKFQSSCRSVYPGANASASHFILTCLTVSFPR